MPPRKPTAAMPNSAAETMPRIAGLSDCSVPGFHDISTMPDVAMRMAAQAHVVR